MLNKILVVEDSALQMKMYRSVLGAYDGCELVHAENGLVALDRLIQEQSIDLIILDINMPKMNGLAFLEAMKRRGFDHVPVIVISTEGKDEDIHRALTAGARGYVKKPWKPDQIRNLIAKVVPDGP